MATLKKILICDDEEGIREALKLVLSDDYNLILVDSGEQVLDTLSKAKDIALVLLDIKMPKISGFDILSDIKKKHPHVKVIMVTGYQSVETAAEASRLGANGYIFKPFKTEAILELVQKNLK